MTIVLHVVSLDNRTIFRKLKKSKFFNSFHNWIKYMIMYRKLIKKKKGKSYESLRFKDGGGGGGNIGCLERIEKFKQNYILHISSLSFVISYKHLVLHSCTNLMDSRQLPDIFKYSSLPRYIVHICMVPMFYILWHF